LSFGEREEIALGRARGESLRKIAARLVRAVSTVSRELAANGGRARYRAGKAHRRAWARSRRPKPAKLAACPPLQATVTAWLDQLWSPVQIARRLRAEFPDDPMMWVSHETIYQSLFVQGRGALRRELTRCLRRGRTYRHQRGRAEKRSRIPDMVMISERPAEVEDRAVPGHWEGDLLVGRNNKSAISTLVERSTRYVLLARLGDHSAPAVRDAITTQILRLPEHLRRSLTWDQGREMANHAAIADATGLEIYFCDPAKPWQRGSNENTNGLLRQYFPKGTDLRSFTADELEYVSWEMNQRPRETLGWDTPAQALDKLLSAASSGAGVATTT
jgi:IS30 family transposase